MTAPVKIYSANWLDKYCALTVSSGSNSSGALCDGTESPVWSSLGSTAAVTETITAVFADTWGNPVTRSVDRLLLLNTNAGAITAQWQDSGGNWNSIPQAALSGLTAGSVIIELPSPVTAAGIRINISATSDSAAEKYLGELKFCASIMSMTGALTSLSLGSTDKGGSYYLSGGQLVAWRQYRKRTATLKAENLSAADRKSLIDTLGNNLFLTFSAACDGDPAQAVEFAQAAPPSENYDRRTGLYAVSLELKER